MHASIFTAELLAHEFGIFPAKQRHDRIRYEMFMDDSWLDFVMRKGAHPGLLCSDMDDNSDKTARYLVLLSHKDRMAHSKEPRTLFS